MNDPNGPVVIDGITHLYYQHRPSLDHTVPVTWGHVSSADLVRWDYHRPAISPDPLLGDRDGSCSGNTVVDETGMVRAFYSGYVDGEPLQRTLLAVSADGGYSFGPPREIVGPPPAVEQIAVLRDPFVWRTTEGWRMVLGAGTSTQQAMMRLYESADLDTWTYLGRLAQMSRTRTAWWDSGGMWRVSPNILHPRSGRRRGRGLVCARRHTQSPVHGDVRRERHRHAHTAPRRRRAQLLRGLSDA